MDPIDISMLPPEQLAMLPALRPPSGVIPNFIDPPSLENSGRLVIYILLPVSFAASALRLGTRLRIGGGLWFDDCTCYLLEILIISLFIYFEVDIFLYRITKRYGI